MKSTLTRPGLSSLTIDSKAASDITEGALSTGLSTRYERRLSELSLGQISTSSLHPQSLLVDSLRDDTDGPFDAKAWVNKILSSHLTNDLVTPTKTQTPSVQEPFVEDGLPTTPGRASGRADFPSDIELRCSALMSKLDFISQETSTKLERAIDEIMRAIPRVGFDLQIMKENVSTLQTGLAAVAWNTKKVEGGTGKVLDKLKYLDTVKQRMEMSRDVLREVQSWSTLEEQVKGFIAADEFNKAGERLQEASKSLEIFQNASDFEARQKLLLELQNQMEASLSPQLVQAISNRDAALMRQYLILFRQIQRENEFKNYYFAFRRTSIIEFWKTPSRDEAAEVSGATLLFNEFLPQFYQNILKLLNEEMSWCSEIFADPIDIISSFVCNIFDSLDPPFATRLANIVAFYHDRSLPEIITAFVEAESFSNQLEQAFRSILKTLSSGGHQRKFSKHISKRMTRQDFNTWQHAVFHPFLEFQEDYGKMEKAYLLTQLQRELKARKSGPPVHVARSLNDMVGLVFSMAEGALSRCSSFTHGYGADGLLDAVNRLFSGFLNECESFLDKLKEEDFQKTDPEQVTDEDDFEFEDLQHEDWTNFQVGLRLLRICWSMSDSLKLFENRTANTFKSLRHLISNSVFLDSSQSSLILLQQSALNSFELHRVFDDDLMSYYSPTTAAIQLFTDASQRFVYESLLQPIVKRLDSYPSLDVWNTTEIKENAASFEVPTFSLSPTDLITHVGEQLLTLPEQFEMYVNDEVLGFAVKSLPFMNGTEEEESVLNAWITSVARGVQYHLHTVILAIPKLSKSGTEQIATDLRYLTNVLTALNMELIEEMKSISSNVAMNDNELKKHLMTTKTVGKEVAETFRTICTARGITG